MAITYTCDQCGHTAPSYVGWLMVAVQFLHNEPSAAATPLGGRMLDATLPDLLFHTAACRDAWCAAVGIVVPPNA